MDYSDFVHRHCCGRPANPQSIRAAECGGGRSEAARTIRRRVGCREDVLPDDWGADHDQGDVQAVHDSGRQVSAVRFHVFQF